MGGVTPNARRLIAETTAETVKVCVCLCFDEDGCLCQPNSGWCAPDCKPEWVGDGYCDVDCFRQGCEWDSDDCSKNFTSKLSTIFPHELLRLLFAASELKLPLPRHSKFDYSACPDTCDRKLLHDNNCDAECNIAPCNFDGEDCYRKLARYRILKRPLFHRPMRSELCECLARRWRL